MTGLPDVAAATRRQPSDISHGRIGILTAATGDRDPGSTVFGDSGRTGATVSS
jgi:hypothetical protein